MKDKKYKLIKDWFYSKTGVSLMHDPSLISLVSEIEALGLDEHYGKQTVLNALNETLRIHDVVQQSEHLVCPKCGNTGRCEPRTLSDPDGQECDCEEHLSLFPNGLYRCTKCWDWWYR